MVNCPVPSYEDFWYPYLAKMVWGPWGCPPQGWNPYTSCGYPDTDCPWFIPPWECKCYKEFLAAWQENGGPPKHNPGVELCICKTHRP
ncbi:MAG: hypothetical protein LBR73_08665 [Oscillospiraceae bacterium]|jgi:hypothetical protein|nr:hypothetical protein [Oscillospiraceae bacterium]